MAIDGLNNDGHAMANDGHTTVMATKK